VSRVDKDFNDRVYQIVGSIPVGRVMTYGQIAALCGASWAAWEVGQIAHFGPDNLPWHRVVNKKGGLAKGYTQGGIAGQQKALEVEGVGTDGELRVDVNGLLWTPTKP
jgi:methylated-DNA-protein-cysteine methyltransferase-like protein